eukprot:15688129-Heterocapsa_arctica.AAC.1
MVRGSSFASFPRRTARACSTTDTAGSPSDLSRTLPTIPASRSQLAMSLTSARSLIAPFPRAAP